MARFLWITGITAKPVDNPLPEGIQDKGVGFPVATPPSFARKSFFHA
jgi:hypothetical protein